MVVKESHNADEASLGGDVGSAFFERVHDLAFKVYRLVGDCFILGIVEGVVTVKGVQSVHFPVHRAVTADHLLNGGKDVVNFLAALAMIVSRGSG
jgi:hypothetical protein